jgi:hypothetical protein
MFLKCNLRSTLASQSLIRGPLLAGASRQWSRLEAASRNPQVGLNWSLVGEWRISAGVCDT